MSVAIYSKRNLIPIWRFSNQIYNRAEFSSYSNKTRLSLSNSQFLDQKVVEWLISPSIGKAIDLVSCGVSGNWADEILNAAKYLQNNKDKLSPQAANLAFYDFTSNESNVNWLNDFYLNLMNEHVDKEVHLVISTLASKAISRAKIKLRNEPRNSLAWLDIARGYSILGQKEKALSSITNALRIAPNHRNVVRAAVRLHIHFGNPDEAHNLLLHNPRTRSDPWLLASELSVSRIAEREPRYFQFAKNIFNSNKFPPEHLTELYSAVGTLEFYSKNFRNARRYIHASLLEPTENTIAQAHWLSQKIKQPELLSHISLDNVQHGYEAKTLYLLKNHNWQTAFNECCKWLWDEPYSSRPAVTCSFIGSTLHENYDVAIKYAYAGLKADPSDKMLLNNLTVLYAYKDKLKQAEIYFKKLDYLNLNKKNENYFIYLATDGLLKFRKGDIEGGRQKYEEAEKLAPNEDKHRVGLHRVREELNAVQNGLNKNFEKASKYIQTILNTKCHNNDEYSPRIRELIYDDFDHWLKPSPLQVTNNSTRLGAGWLPNALEQLEQINEEAAEENFPEIHGKSIAKAKNLLQKLHDNPIEPAVYPSMDGEVSIFFKSQSLPAAVLIRIDNSQRVVCHSSISRVSKRKHYNDDSELPDDFLKNELLALE